ncbi:MAG: hypothetical protein HN356_03530 [Calditrichaeota bacterium]|nr:hypothetical protein [Calditrichota bacterium]MBT7789340.1 hypothetical protein [Calditrichota bacterium]
MFMLFMGLVMLACKLLDYPLFGKWDFPLMIGFFALGTLIVIIKKIKKGKG